MELLEKVKLGIEACRKEDFGACKECPYRCRSPFKKECYNLLYDDILTVIAALEKGEIKK